MDEHLVDIKRVCEVGQLYYDNERDDIFGIIPNNPYNSCHAADLLEIPNGDILAVWFAGSNEGNADVSIVMSRLKKGETSWSMPIKISDDDTRSEQNPSLFLKTDNEIWVIYTAQKAKTENCRFNLQYTAEIRYKKSFDNGYTWGETNVLFGDPGSFCRQKIQILSNGRYIFGNWICYDDDSRNGSDITVFQISDDEGETWRRVELPNSAGRVHANVIELESGHLVALMRSRFADNVYRSESLDFGDSWTSPERTELPNNNSSISAIKLKSGRIAMVYNPVKYNDNVGCTVWPKQRCPIEIALSEDGGVTWPYRRVVEFGEGFEGYLNDINNSRYEYPVVMQTKDDAINVAYSWKTRKNIKYVRITERWILGDLICKGAEDLGIYPRKRI